MDNISIVDIFGNVLGSGEKIDIHKNGERLEGSNYTNANLFKEI